MGSGIIPAVTPPARPFQLERDLAQLLDVAAHVDAVRIERPELARGVVEPPEERLRIGPTEETHCQFPLLFAWSPSTSQRMNQRSPWRQSMPSCFVRNEAATSRARL